MRKILNVHFVMLFLKQTERERSERIMEACVSERQPWNVRRPATKQGDNVEQGDPGGVLGVHWENLGGP